MYIMAILMNKRVQKYKEKTFVHAGAAGEFEPPLKLVTAIISRWGPGDNFSRTERPNLSISLLTFGNAYYEQDGRQGKLGHGSIFIANKGSSQLLKTGSDGVLHKRSVILEGAALDSIILASRLTGVDSITPRDLPHTMNLFRQAFHCLAVKKPGFPREGARIAWDILMTCAEGLSTVYPDNLRQATEFIQANVHRPLHLSEIAMASGLSVRQCTRLFKEFTGFSPVQFAIQQRMSMAENLVINSTEPFKQIAQTLGYEDALHFSVQFKQHFKISPRHYRKLVLGS